MPKSLNAAQAGWIFFISYAAGIGLSLLMLSGSGEVLRLDYFLLYVVLGQVGCNVLPALIWLRYKGIPLKEAFLLRRVTWKVLGLSVCIYALFQVFLLFVHQATSLVSLALGSAYQMSVYPVANDWLSLLVLLVCIGLLPPICEELLFRGALLGGYRVRGTLFAASMSALLFALFHDNPYRLAELFLAAWISALIVLRARSIIPGVVVHIATNIAYVVGSYAAAGDLVGAAGERAGAGAASLIVLGAASIPCLWGCWLLLRKLGSMTESRQNAVKVEGEAAAARGAYWLLPVGLAGILFVVKVAWL
ncbi:CPBP family intramembrane glutamic endopeptidase [Xylanibacillus composti]|uniref:CAAX prenyl protease 2/Lysostaphin resistance protein A-like domain-containing protein n=1 Tax=Xylanibacillus composti TaxID=1572762 RepID=A0A8J4H1W9_9BACL|nr:CPBP family intramembrane glutamic endopeptidase [Xylanibacillus composti]GIQ69437.1 hypothetical protein XYCOK13_22610 [Xylanibacillus composti]